MKRLNSEPSTTNMNLLINGVYQMSDSANRFRVLETDLTQNKAAIIALNRELTRPSIHNLSDLQDDLETHSLIPVTQPPESIPEIFLNEKKREYRDQMMATITPLVKDGPIEMLRVGFWPQIVSTAKQANLAPNTVYAAVTHYFQGGCNPNAIIPHWHKCGRKDFSAEHTSKEYRPTNQPGAYPLSAVDIKNIISGAEKFYAGSNTWNDAYEETLSKYYCIGIDIIEGREVRRTMPVGKRPSFWQFLRIGNKKLGTIGRLKRKLGKRGFELTGRGKPGSQAAEALLPGQVAEIDWTFTDTVAVNRNSRLSIGRLVVYAIVDRASGIVLSIYITLSTGKFDEAARAILICLEDKVDLCAQHGVKITHDKWPVRHLFDTLVSDKGEIDSWKATPICTGLGIKLIHTVSRRPDGKGTIEALMKVINYALFRKLPGATTGLQQRCTTDPRVTAIYDFDQVNTLLHALVVRWNQRIRKNQPMTKGMVAAGIPPIPNRIWKWAEESGCLRTANIEETRMHLLPWHEVSVTEYGFSIKGLKYLIPDIDPKTPGGVEANEWLAKARIERWKLQLAIDPSTVAHVWFRHAPKRKPPALIKCPLSPGQDGFTPFTWEEYLFFMKAEKMRTKDYMNGTLRLVDQEFKAIVKSVTDEAAHKTAAARDGLSKVDQVRGIDANRRNEADERSKPKPTAHTKAPEISFKGYFDEDDLDNEE